ncbi:MAG: RNA methyltransferase [Anaerolineae bacterium]|nr:RNA methyltransferase [Anaerolineae bacterium]
MITSLQNDRVKLAHGLITGSKSRRKLGKIALEGVRLIRDAVEAGYLPEFILYDPDAVDISALDLPADLLFDASPEVLRHICATEQPQGIVGVFPMPTPSLPRQPRRVLILDALRDPGNLGAILRTAAAAGVDAVLLAPGSVDPYNDKALRGGMSAHFRVPVVPQKWGEIAAYCAGLSIYLADMDGDVNYDAADWLHGWALIVGGEAHGAGEQAAALATQRIAIPMAAATESLNAAAAAAVILFEAARQSR